MPIMVRVAGKGDVVAIFEIDEPLHGIGRGWIHADLSVPIERHESKRRIDRIVDDRQIESIPLRDARPIVHAGAAQGVDAHAYLGIANDIHVQDAAQVLNVVGYVVVRVGRCSAPCRAVRCSLDAECARPQQVVRPILDPFGDVRIRGTSICRVVLEAAIVGRIVRGRDDDAIGHTAAASAVVGENGMRDGGGRRVLIAAPQSSPRRRSQPALQGR